MKVQFVALTAAMHPADRAAESAMTDNRAATASIAQPSSNILWARTDGRRMASDPVLYQQGVEDKARCEAEATATGALDWPVLCVHESIWLRSDEVKVALRDDEARCLRSGDFSPSAQSGCPRLQITQYSPS